MSRTSLIKSYIKVLEVDPLPNQYVIGILETGESISDGVGGSRLSNTFFAETYGIDDANKILDEHQQIDGLVIYKCYDWYIKRLEYLKSL